jgi:hypothetical protein
MKKEKLKLPKHIKKALNHALLAGGCGLYAVLGFSLEPAKLIISMISLVAAVWLYNKAKTEIGAFLRWAIEAELEKKFDF